MSLSVCLITRNEESNLPRTLASVAFADEIIVVDSGSTDRTLGIARDFGPQVHVFSEAWQGFAAQKNFALAKATCDWVLSLDADEELTPALAAEIQSLCQNGRFPAVSDPAAYTVARRNLFLGRWIKHGGYYPDRKLRLWRRGLASFTDRPVHETAHTSAPTAPLRHDLIHHAYPNLDAYLEHMNRYSSLGAQLAVTRGQTSRDVFAFVGNIYLRPYFTFFYNYFLRLGFLDGREGLLLHLYHSAYVSQKYAKAWALARS